MLDHTLTLPEDPEELRSFTARLLTEVKTQAILIEKLRHQLAGHRAHRFGASSETAEQLQLALETSEIAAAAMTARMKLPDIEEKAKPKRRPIPDHIPRMEVELTPGAEACADCGGRLRRIGAQAHGRVSVGIAHEGDPPVVALTGWALACVGSTRTILPTCWRFPLPRRSSAAPKRRSTIRMFWWTALNPSRKNRP